MRILPLGTLRGSKDEDGRVREKFPPALRRRRESNYSEIAQNIQFFLTKPGLREISLPEPN